MFSHKVTTIETGRIIQYVLYKEEEKMTFQDVIKAWKESVEFRQFYTNLLKECPFTGFFWEHPPVKKTTVHQTYEFVLVNSPRMEFLKAEPDTFKAHYSTTDSIVVFDNLGKNAKLIAPCPLSTENHYTHLARFVRNAPATQVNRLWEVIGEEYEAILNDNLRWLSTAGMGVYWLHIRFDTRPKYYRYRPYKSTSH